MSNQNFKVKHGLTVSGSLIHTSGSSIGIGTLTPSKPLTVTGDISASGDIYVGDDINLVNGSRIQVGNDLQEVIGQQNIFYKYQVEVIIMQVKYYYYIQDQEHL